MNLHDLSIQEAMSHPLVLDGSHYAVPESYGTERGGYSVDDRGVIWRRHGRGTLAHAMMPNLDDIGGRWMLLRPEECVRGSD